MKNERFYKILGMIIATGSLGARGLACGPCSDVATVVVPVLPPSSDGGVADAGEVDDGLDALCTKHCGIGAISCEATTIALDDGGVMPALECTQYHGGCGAGRRPEGLVRPGFAQEAETEAGWLARAAFLEAASVDAFRSLRRDLRALGAPRRLLRAASRAARDEKRHARRMQALARRRGASVPVPRVLAREAILLEALAAHNAAEGCVRETFGALVARWQAGAAGDREVRASMARIAGDEARHAALAWQIDAWAQRRLDKLGQARVGRAREEAARSLLAEIAQGPSQVASGALGIPARGVAEKLARQMIRALAIA
ncbi:ferritin-like domain-containing protein [Polyangium aurulentum]|uniref:ferritin-like domain-containing protein n=1 Tax=Polyangium aurulentum TaxID=2567896 RepID=UPI0010AE7C1A|nr:ferritin-like domain-containing protein [Polyangium aurulentum]UQA62243.1 ferritin-like domain-containing protein [Polyangium aurulentum]